MTQFNFCPKCGTKCIHPRTNDAMFGAMLDTACPNPHCAWAYWTGAPISMGAQSIQYEQYLVPNENWEHIIKQNLPDFDRQNYEKPRDVAAIFSPEENRRIEKKNTKVSQRNSKR